jgi:hypothetical protein
MGKVSETKENEKIGIASTRRKYHITRMATSGQVIERLGEVLGLSSLSSLDRSLRPLREAELVPMGRAGRASSHGHYEAKHLANMIMGLAGAQPSDAAEAVKLLRPLKLTSASPSEVALLPQGPKRDFGAALEQLIQTDPEVGDLKLPVSRETLELTLCLDPSEVIISYIRPMPYDDMHMEWYRSDNYYTIFDAQQYNLQRITRIWGPVILTARDLLADTQRVLTATTADVPKDENRRIPWQGGGG